MTIESETVAFAQALNAMGSNDQAARTAAFASALNAIGANDSVYRAMAVGESGPYALSPYTLAASKDIARTAYLAAHGAEAPLAEALPIPEAGLDADRIVSADVDAVIEPTDGRAE